MSRQLIQAIDREASVSCLILCIEFKINYKCICVYHCVAINLVISIINNKNMITIIFESSS
jgi:hypothetical protein